ncbi:MAG: hypothetical protein N2545_02605 [Thermoflexales bacterium]|nr:hypothetical protein [Thermoflexales bacterium]
MGTNLITSMGDPALDGVYKLVSVQRGSAWVPAIKISETPEKTLTPGQKSVWRLYDQRGMATADLLCLRDEDPRRQPLLVLRHPSDHTKSRTLRAEDLSAIEPLMVEVMREGKLVYELPTIEAMRAARQRDIEHLDPGVRRLIRPHTYHVSLSEALWTLKQRLVADQSRFNAVHHER